MENRGKYLSELRRSNAAGIHYGFRPRSSLDREAIEEGLEDYNMSFVYPEDEDTGFGDDFDDLDPYDYDPDGLDDIEHYGIDPYGVYSPEDYLTVGGDSDLLNER